MPYNMNDTSKYNDIIDLPHHVSKTRPQMDMIERAAQFSPFAALTGYDAAVKETARLTDSRVILDEESKTILDAKFQILFEHINACPEVTVTYFQPDLLKKGGEYITKTGCIRKIQPIEKNIVFTDSVTLKIDDIVDISGSIFPDDL